MSWRHAEAVASIESLRPPMASVLMALAHHADQFTGTCYPSLDRLALFTRLSRRAIQLAIVDLEAAQLLAVVRGKNQRASTYTLTLPGIDVIAVGQGAGGASHGAPRARHGAGRAPQQSENSHENGTRAARAPAGELLPEGWRPDDVALARAKKDFPHVDLDLETHRFVDKNRADGTRVAHPASAWRAWLGRAAQFAARDAAAEGRAGRGRRGPDRTAAPGLRSRLQSPPHMVVEGMDGRTLDAE